MYFSSIRFRFVEFTDYNTLNERSKMLKSCCLIFAQSHSDKVNDFIVNIKSLIPIQKRNNILVPADGISTQLLWYNCGGMNP